MQQMGLGIQRVSSFINSSVKEKNSPNVGKAREKQHAVFLSSLVKQHMFVLWPWFPYGIEGNLLAYKWQQTGLLLCGEKHKPEWWSV